MILHPRMLIIKRNNQAHRLCILPHENYVSKVTIRDRTSSFRSSLARTTHFWSFKYENALERLRDQGSKGNESLASSLGTRRARRAEMTENKPMGSNRIPEHERTTNHFEDKHISDREIPYIVKSGSDGVPCMWNRCRWQDTGKIPSGFQRAKNSRKNLMNVQAREA